MVMPAAVPVPIVSVARQAVASVTPVTPERKYFSPTAYSKQYRIDHKDEIAQKNRERYAANKHKMLLNKQLAYLNRGLVKTPSAASIATYHLLYDEFSGVWSSAEVD